VKAWQKSFADAYSNANKLAAVARTLPGTSAGGVSNNPGCVSHLNKGLET
jgi:hypothetical protein